jgi:hypothetical protein
MVNGQQVPLATVTWSQHDGHLEGRLPFVTWHTDEHTAVIVPPGPVAVLVMVTDGKGASSAQASWHFVAQPPPDKSAVRHWVPIATSHAPIDRQAPLPVLVAYSSAPAEVGVGAGPRVWTDDLPLVDLRVGGGREAELSLLDAAVRAGGGRDAAPGEEA